MLLHAAFVTGEVWGDALEPARIQPVVARQPEMFREEKKRNKAENENDKQRIIRCVAESGKRKRTQNNGK